MSYFFTSESVSEGHPDKVADQISDAILDNLLAQDRDSKVACETLVTTGQVVLAGELKTTAVINEQEVVREVIKRIGFVPSVADRIDRHPEGRQADGVSSSGCEIAGYHRIWRRQQAEARRHHRHIHPARRIYFRLGESGEG